MSLITLTVIFSESALAEKRSFAVSDVPVAKFPLAEIEYRNGIEVEIGSAIRFYAESDKKLVAPLAQTNKSGSFSSSNGKLHPFIRTVYHAFSEHRPLVLSPDMIWLLIAQGFAQHVNSNAEELRSKFVSHEGKRDIEVFMPFRPEDDVSNDQWRKVFSQFTSGIKQHTRPEFQNLIVASFSTTGSIERSAFEITFMNSMKSYFRYSLHTFCGIPSITLEGTPDDWLAVISKAKLLRQYDLAWWIDELIPVLEQFYSASKGEIDTSFWQKFFKEVASKKLSNGVPFVNGWITKFFPYSVEQGTGIDKNRIISDLTFNESFGTRVYNNLRKISDYFLGSTDAKNMQGGMKYSEFPAGSSYTPFCWKTPSGSYSMDFVAGFVGFSQDDLTKAIRPEIGWAVRNSSTDSQLLGCN